MKKIKELGLEKEFKKWLKDVKRKEFSSDFRVGDKVKLIFCDETIPTTPKNSIGVLENINQHSTFRNIVVRFKEHSLYFDQSEMSKYFRKIK